jgi:hypothetical protein
MFNPRTFPCPNCREIIHDQMKVCRFCQVPVDPAIAAQLAYQQSRVNQACSDASFLRIAAATMFVFMAISLVPFISFADWGFLMSFFFVAVMAVRWQVNFGSLVTNDPDYVKAKQARNVAILLWVVAIPVGFILRPFIPYLIMRFLR